MIQPTTQEPLAELTYSEHLALCALQEYQRKRDGCDDDEGGWREEDGIPFGWIPSAVALWILLIVLTLGLNLAMSVSNKNLDRELLRIERGAK